ncbi:MAG: hypothetical protein Q8N88_05515 [Nanoarchaeota archaeon]|nr:hypothetical protein [Nanoarchaeota archaeon]
MKEGNVGLVLESYQDLFSDFDPRPFSGRSLSVDFLDEAKRATRDTPEGFELNLLVPEKLREPKKELIIKKRLENHFKKHREEKGKNFRKLILEGIIFVVFGILIMISATAILFYYTESSFFTSFLVIILEPAGWFLFWEGLDLIIFESKKGKKERTFYHKMAMADINFRSY